jgi:hypothetical protein
MKTNITIGLFAGFLVFVLFMNFSQGPANSQGQDRTGSPFTEVSGSCQTCHATGTFNPGLEIELLDGDTPVQQYEPNKTYTLRYTITANNGTPSGYGMQSVILNTADDSAIAGYGAAPANTQLTELNGRTYFEQSALVSSNTFEIEWTAPDAGVGSVTAYATGIAANGNGSSGGDAGASATAEFTEITSNVSVVEGDVQQLSAFPNPITDAFQLGVTAARAAEAQIQITDMQGRTVALQTVDVVRGDNVFPLNASNWTSGVYFALIRVDNTVSTIKLIKK